MDQSDAIKFLFFIDRKTKDPPSDTFFVCYADKTILIVLYGDIRYNGRIDNAAVLEAMYTNVAEVKPDSID
jgi:hypothetical protein